MRKRNLQYTIRTISINDDAPHYCSGRIVAVIGSTRNPSGKWYLTVLVERDDPEE